MSAARQLLSALPPDSSRASVLVFSLHTQALATLSAPAVANEALAAWVPVPPDRECFSYSRSGKRKRVVLGAPLHVDPSTIMCEGATSIGQALHDAVLEVIHRDGEHAARLPIFVVFTDGEASAPEPKTARRHALKAARYLRAHGVVVHEVDFGAAANRVRRDVMREVAEITGGEVLDSSDPELAARLANLGRVAVRKLSLHNRTTGVKGSIALTDGPAQEFSGEIPLVAGENLLALDFELRGELGFSRELRVSFEPQAP